MLLFKSKAKHGLRYLKVSALIALVLGSVDGPRVFAYADASHAGLIAKR
jgi:hypothetical protein